MAEYPKHRRQVQNLHTTDLREKKTKKKPFGLLYVRPVVTGYLFLFSPLFAETSYVSFVPARDHLGIAKKFHD
jgi:hypothetical protein